MLARTLKLALLSAVALPSVLSAQNLINAGPVPTQGAGLGAVLTVLTLNNTNDISSGCISPAGSSFANCGYVNNVVQNSSQVRFLSEIGTGTGTLGTDLRLIANPAEPAGGPATLSTLELMLFNAAGNEVGQWFLNAPQNYPTNDPGTGNAGFGIRLDAVGAAQFDALVAGLLGGGATLGTISIGLGATWTDVQGSHETIHVARVNSTSVVPEPSTYALMAAGLAGLLVARRRRNHA